MKQLICSIVLATFLVGCAESKVINHKRHEPYGLLDKEKEYNPEVVYTPCWGNIFWSVVLFETIVIPVVLAGYYLFEPDHARGQ